MLRSETRRRLAWLALTAVVATGRAPAQQPGAWNDARARELAQRAVDRRLAQLADSGLRDYEARARGFVTFLAQGGEGLADPPKVVKADELALEIFWRAPNQSKQRILGRRDTLLLPTDIRYHRDHLGIIQNNFPDIIRLGDGDEVEDVPHPLSPVGLAEYELRLVDSLRIRLPSSAIEVYQLQLRPRDPTQPRAVGSLFIERATAQLVRMSISFTRAAFKERELEDLVVTLENGLVDGRFWLPRRQEIEIRRTGAWLDFPFRGIIRGRWEIRDYVVNVNVPPPLFGGDEIVLAPPDRQAAFAFEGNILDKLPPEVRAATDDDVAIVQEQARTAVRAQLLQRATGTQLAARAVSDFVRVNRVEGFAPGVGLARRIGDGWRVGAQGRWATADGTVRGGATVGWEGASGAGLSLRGGRDLGDVSLVAEASGVVNSIAAQEFGRDWTAPYDRVVAALRVDLPRLGTSPWRVAIEGARERHRSVRVNASPSFGRYEPVPTITPLEGTRLSLLARRPAAIGWWGGEVRAVAGVDAWRIDGPEARWLARPMADLSWERAAGTRDRAVLRTIAGAVIGPVPPAQFGIRVGGAVTLPGVPFHAQPARPGAEPPARPLRAHECERRARAVRRRRGDRHGRHGRRAGLGRPRPAHALRRAAPRRRRPHRLARADTGHVLDRRLARLLADPLMHDAVPVRVSIVDVVVARFGGAGLEVLLLRRAPGVRCAGAWEIVHGRIEPDERPEQAAAREVHEETALGIARLYNVTLGGFYLHHAGVLALSCVFCAIVDDRHDPVLGVEHDAFRWLPVSVARDECAWPREREAMDHVAHLLRNGADAGAVEDVLRVR
ncbi:MAG: NUDIX domain-containing protein [Gemmatimonadaceae bacterium]|nr:NUDIX domain-containing protein [Gemmatimonadaceae bacterium]